MNNSYLRKLISQSRGTAAANTYFAYTLSELDVLSKTAHEILTNVPPSFGSCALLSAAWAAILQDRHSIPAIAIAGDLEIHQTTVFKCEKNLPDAGESGRLVIEEWDGHCWIEVDGIVGDLSVFRTAYAINRPSILKDFIVSTFGRGRGALISRKASMPNGMRYVPKFVLNEDQINGLIAGLRHHIEHDLKSAPDKRRQTKDH